MKRVWVIFRYKKEDSNTMKQWRTKNMSIGTLNWTYDIFEAKHFGEYDSMEQIRTHLSADNIYGIEQIWLKQ